MKGLSGVFSEYTYAGIAALALGLVIGKISIPLLKILKFGQVIRSDGPSAHLKKKGTPTMGGIIFLVPSLVVTWAVGMRFGSENIAALVIITIFTLGYGLVGLADDAIKVVFKRPLGLLAREKLLWQTLLTVSAGLVLHTMGHSTDLSIPFSGYTLHLGLLYWAFLLFIGIGFSNAVNLTDGVDGLCGGTMVFSCLAYVIIGLVTGTPIVVLLAATLAGALVSFLYFNRHPARVFMGDVGSLALGGAFVAMGVLTKTELLLPIVGAVFVWSAISVTVQVLYFRRSGGKRLFRMAPYHHSLELSGWSEWKIITWYYTAAAIFLVIGCMGLVNMGR